MLYLEALLNGHIARTMSYYMWGTFPLRLGWIQGELLFACTGMALIESFTSGLQISGSSLMAVKLVNAKHHLHFHSRRMLAQLL